MENMETLSEDRMEGYHSYPSNREEIRPGRYWSRKNTEMFEPHMVACVQTPSPEKECNWTQDGPSFTRKSQNDPHIFKWDQTWNRG